MEKTHKVVIVGAGRIGKAVGLLLRELADFEVDLFFGDREEKYAQDARAWVLEGSSRGGRVEAFQLPQGDLDDRAKSILGSAEVLLDCVPGEGTPRIAEIARDFDRHYANLTEHVEETEEIRRIAAGAKGSFILQTGLAPGYINVLALKLLRDFLDKFDGVDSVDRLSMKVGAITPAAPPAPHFYAFTWSEAGVANEYVHPSLAIRNFETVTLDSLSDVQPVVVNGVLYEEALTSGGASDLPKALKNVKDLDYKTLRHPGHYGWIRGLIEQAPSGADLPKYLEEEMKRAGVKKADEDLVVLYAAVEKRTEDGALWRLEASKAIPPFRIGGRTLSAIQATTAAGLAESARLLLEGKCRGVCLQSQIPADDFLSGPFVKAVYK